MFFCILSLKHSRAKPLSFALLLFGALRRRNKPPVLPGEENERNNKKNGELDASRIECCE